MASLISGPWSVPSLFEQLPQRHLVVATGGGTFVDPTNRAAINANGVSVWLDAPLDRVIARLPSDKRRPLAADRSELERIYHQRRAAIRKPTGGSMLDELASKRWWTRSSIGSNRDALGGSQMLRISQADERLATVPTDWPLSFPVIRRAVRR